MSATITMQAVQHTRTSAAESTFAKKVIDQFVVGLNGHALHFPKVVTQRDAKGNELAFTTFNVVTKGGK